MPTLYSESLRVDTVSPRNDDGPGASDFFTDDSDDNGSSHQQSGGQLSSQDPATPKSNDESVTEQNLARFQARFSGYTLAYGQTTIGPTDARGKVTTKNYTIRKPITSDLYAGHLYGRNGLGIVPLCDDGEKCIFGALDIDDIKIDHVNLERRVQSLGLPLVVCRSKSGGAHLYLFLSAPTAATLIREALEAYAALLGLAAGTEIFPKQTSRANSTDVGNYINLPYYQQTAGGRYAIHNGVILPLVEFLALADAKAVTPEELARTMSSDLDESDILWEAPPCLGLRPRG